MAIDLIYHTILRYIGAYASEMNGVDAIAFTVGIGENYIDARASICANLTYLGMELDPAANDYRGKEVLISAVFQCQSVRYPHQRIADDCLQYAGIN